jgi:hypothetical protein
MNVLANARVNMIHLVLDSVRRPTPLAYKPAPRVQAADELALSRTDRLLLS